MIFRRGICIHQSQEFLLCCKEAAQSGKKHFPAPVLEIWNILQMHSMEDCMEAPLMVLKIKSKKNKKILYLKSAFHHCSHRSGRHYGKSLITLRLKCGPGKSSFQESFSWSSSATALISTRVGTPQRAKWRGRAWRGRRLNWERASLRPGGNIWLKDRYRNKSWLFKARLFIYFS